MPGVPLRITIKSGKNPYAEGEAKGGPAPASGYTRTTKFKANKEKAAKEAHRALGKAKAAPNPGGKKNAGATRPGAAKKRASLVRAVARPSRGPKKPSSR